jgi:bifunctional non-homologous end joining protein LigD
LPQDSAHRCNLFVFGGRAGYLGEMLLRTRRPPSGFIKPCLPSPAEQPGWLHEVKHDGFRLMVRRDVASVRLFTRNGIDWSGRFPLIVHAAGALRARSCLIDGEAIAYDGDGLASFELLRGRRHDRQVALCAFDLLELDGRDLRSTPLEDRKRTLTRLIGKPPPGIMLNATFEEPGDIVFKHACALGCEGIVSKRLGSRYRSGHSRDWIKSKNPAAPAVKREAEEDWRKGR